MNKIKRKIISVVLILVALLSVPAVLLSVGLSGAVFDQTYFAELPCMVEKLKEAEGRKIVIIGTSSVAFGIDSERLERNLNDSGADYTVCNFGLYGALGTKIMLDLSERYIDENDIVIFAPEPDAQTMSLFFSPQNTWRAFDGNYSLFFSVAEENRSSLAGNYIGFVQEKFKYKSTQKPSGSGVYAKSSFNEQCDMIYERSGNVMYGGVDSNHKIAFEKELFTPDFVEYVNEYAEKVTKKGAEIYFSFAPVNADSVISDEESKTDYVNFIENNFSFSTMGEIDDFIYDKEWFYDSNVHLNSAGAAMHTDNLYYKICGRLGKDYSVKELPEKPALPSFSQTEDGDNRDSEYFTYALREDGTYLIDGITDEGAELSRITLPYRYNEIAVTGFSSGVFKGNTAITELTLQKNIAYISDASFDGCVNLKNIRLLQDDPTKIGVGAGLLDGVSADCKIYVNEESLGLYINNYFWSYYSTALTGEKRTEAGGNNEDPEQGDAPEGTEKFTVKIRENPAFTCEDYFYTVKEGGKLVIELNTVVGAKYISCDYKNCSVLSKGNKVTVTLRNIMQNCEISFRFDVKKCEIIYDANGGKVKGSGDTVFVREYSLQVRRRINTERGTEILYREGYSLTGWNTLADGTGEHIGLGSRLTVSDGESRTLYAEWKRWTDADYRYALKSDGTISLTGIDGVMLNELVLPEMIDGKTVTEIAKDFSKGITGNVKELYIPFTVLKVEENAFTDLDIDTLWFYDNIISIYDNSFNLNTLVTVHINAVLQPRFVRGDANAQFAENIDNMILNQGNRKMLFFAGCSMPYGLDGAEVEKAFGEYKVIDLGVIGGTNAAFQFDIITNFCEEGDVFIHAPEQMSPYQLMYSYAADSRIFTMVEKNYDLLSFADIRNIEGFFKAFTDFNGVRAKLPAQDYSSHDNIYNSYGDIALERKTPGEDKSYSNGEYYFNTELLTEQSFARLCSFYDHLQAKGVRVLFSFAPINKTPLNTEERIADAYKFEEFYRQRSENNGYSVISSVDDYMYSGEYFFDSDYHLNDLGAALRTERLINDLKRAGV